MTIFQGPDTSRKEYESKFLRFGERIHVTDPGDTESFHSELAEKDGIVFDFIEMQIRDLNEVDGGKLRVQHDETGSTLLFYGDTKFFPFQTETARERTGEVAAQITPESEIMITMSRRPGALER